jgi:hypothetical protein
MFVGSSPQEHWRESLSDLVAGVFGACVEGRVRWRFLSPGPSLCVSDAPLTAEPRFRNASLMRLFAARDCALLHLSAQTRRRVGRLAILCAAPLSAPGFSSAPLSRADGRAAALGSAQSIAFRKLRATPALPRSAPARKLSRRLQAAARAGCELATAQAPEKIGEPLPRPDGLEPPRWRSPSRSIGARPGRVEERVFSLLLRRLRSPCAALALPRSAGPCSPAWP